MTPQQIADKLASRPKGTIFSIVSRRLAKTKKDVSAIIEKESHIQFQLAEYANTANVKSGIQSGEREKPHLPKGVKETFYVDSCKFYRTFGGNECFGGPIAGNKPKSIFYKNGETVSVEEIKDDLLASELAEKKTKSELAEVHQSPFAMISVSNIVSIH